MFPTQPSLSTVIIKHILRYCVVLVCACCLMCVPKARAQKKDTIAKPETVSVLVYGDNMYGIHTDSGDLKKFIGNAVFIQGTDTLYCDSLYQNAATKIVEAFGNVRIAQAGGTQGTSDYLRYATDKKLALMQGNVQLTDGKNELQCPELTYDLGTKTGVYTQGGILHNDSATVTSRAGIYNVNTEEAHFTGKVVITDPQYNIRSEDLVYNTRSKVTRFYAQSVVTRDNGKSVLTTKDGTYDGANGIAHFFGRSSIWNDGQYIEADSLHYDKTAGYALANGNVIAIDTTNHSSMYCGHAEYYRKPRILWATIKPVLVQANGKDTIYIRADTFYSAPMVRDSVKKAAKLKTGLADTSARADSLAARNVRGIQIPPRKTDSVKAPYRIPLNSKGEAKTTRKKRKEETPQPPPLTVTDTATADSTAPLYFIGYHHVLIFSDSLQGKCDSLTYTRSDSTIRMIYAPIAWSHNSQITGDTISLMMDSAELKSMYVPNNALIVSQSGPEKAQLYDQIQGKTLMAYFHKNTITKMDILPNSEAIYYSKDEKGAYLGVNQAKSEKMYVYFDEQKIMKILFVKDFTQTMTPMEKANLPETRLSRFKWLIEQRPKDKEELFR
jgi:lipopolysaccharide export system protein LptA